MSLIIINSRLDEVAVKIRIDRGLIEKKRKIIEMRISCLLTTFHFDHFKATTKRQQQKCDY